MRAACLVLCLALAPPVSAAEPRAPLYATFLGGSGFERVQGVFIGPDGFLYAGGQTHSADLALPPGTAPLRKNGPPGGPDDLDRADGLVVKLSPDGRQVIWARLIGGSRRDQIYAVRTDRAGNVYVLGSTGSPDFPTTEGAWDRRFDGRVARNALSDVFIAKFDPRGRLVFSTFLGGGGQGEENPRGALWLDEENGLIYVAGLTGARDFPTMPGALQPAYGGGESDAFVAAISMDGRRLVHATYLGGSGADHAFTAIVPHPDGSIYVAGRTTSPDFPATPGAFATRLQPGGADAFIARLSPDLGRLVFASLLGGSGEDTVSHNQGLTVDRQARPVVVGHTNAPDFPTTPGAFATRLSGPDDMFVAVLSADGTRLVAASLLGGSEGEFPSGVAVDAAGRIHLGGETLSRDLPVTADALQPRFAMGLRGSDKAGDGLYAVFAPDLSHLVYLSYLGGPGPAPVPWEGDRVRSVWIGSDGRVLLGGVTNSPGFPVTADALQPRLAGSSDGFLMLWSALD